MKDLFFDSAMELFNEDWLFLSPANISGAIPEQISSDAEPVSLPHSWNAEGWSYEPLSYDAPEGIGWYFKRLPPNTKFTSIKFEGVSAECEVFLNGALLNHNLGAYKVFEVELTGMKSDGSDLLAVKVTDKQNVSQLPENCDPLFAASPRFVRWATPMGSSLHAGGIWRNIMALKRGPVYMRPPEIRIIGKSIAIVPDIEGNCKSCKLKCELSRNGKTLASNEIDANAEKLSLKVEDFCEWLPLNPELYSLETTLLDPEGKELQTIRQPVAFFDFCIRDSEFFVNGKPYFLRGQNGFPHCNVPHDKEYITRYVSKIREQGVEISRFHTEPPSHAWLDECDRQGIMVIFEMALHGSFGCYPYGNEEFKETALDEMRSLFIEYRRHPSIAMWCLGNEMIVSSERDIGLGPQLFDVLDKWITELRELDPRPVIASSGSDAVNLVSKSVGDVYDMHQYGGWYVENLRDLRNFGRITQKNDMVFQPCISTESVAAYTNDDGEFFIKHGDIRQKKMVAMRLGKIKNFSKQAQDYQAFLLKEYAEEMWRLRHAESNFAGYIPFGQYTWFKRPFDKGPDGIKEKMIWETYRKVMGPVHIQFECWDRKITEGGSLSGNIHLFHEDIHLPETAGFSLKILCNGKVFLEKEFQLEYHQRVDCKIETGPFSGIGKHELEIKVFHEEKLAASNSLEFQIYPKLKISSGTGNIAIYDPSRTMVKTLKSLGVEDCRVLNVVDEILELPPENNLLLVGAYALDKNTVFFADEIRQWINNGGKIVVLEQNPNVFSQDIFNIGIGVAKKNQPYWSPWATNLVKHTDRADMLQEEDPVFDGLNEEDLFWWNGDTFLAHAYLDIKTPDENDRILSRIGNGLGDDELMPVEYNYIEPGYSIIMMKRSLGKGTVLLSSMLIGSKAATDPVARRILLNMINRKS
jgi:hypothetical protein